MEIIPARKMHENLHKSLNKNLLGGAALLCVLSIWYVVSVVRPLNEANADAIASANDFAARYHTVRRARAQNRDASLRATESHRKVVASMLDNRSAYTVDAARMAIESLAGKSRMAVEAIGAISHISDPADDTMPDALKLSCVLLPVKLIGSWGDYLPFRTALLAKAIFIQQEEIEPLPKQLSKQLVVTQMTTRICMRGGLNEMES